MKIVEMDKAIVIPDDCECICTSIPADFKNIDASARKQLVTLYGDYKKWFKRDGAGAVVTHDPLTINLVTKLNYYDSATIDSMDIALGQAADMCYGYDIFELSMIKSAACDGLKWGAVKKLIEKHFGELDMMITVYEK